MNHREELNVDEGLRGNEQIEEAIAALQQEPSQEMLAHTLTVIRRRMNENGQVIIAVEPPVGDRGLQIQAVRTEDGENWWVAFTGFEEEMRGSEGVMSTFLTDMGHLFTSALEVEEISGIILNPWNRTLMLNKSFNRFLIISLDVLICRYSPLFRAFPALFISEEPHKSFYYPSCFRSQK